MCFVTCFDHNDSYRQVCHSTILSFIHHQMLSKVKTLIEKLSRTFGTYFRDVVYANVVFDWQTFLDTTTASYLASQVDDDCLNFTIIF